MVISETEINIEKIKLDHGNEFVIENKIHCNLISDLIRKVKELAIIANDQGNLKVCYLYEKGLLFDLTNEVKNIIKDQNKDNYDLLKYHSDRNLKFVSDPCDSKYIIGIKCENEQKQSNNYEKMSIEKIAEEVIAYLIS